MEKLKQCTQCEEDKSPSEFAWKNKEKKIKASECKKCHRIIRNTYYKNNKELEKKRTYNARKKRVERYKKWFKDHKSKLSCEICGESRTHCLDFHHIDPSKKEFTISVMLYSFSLKRIQNEMKKCQVVCATCHRDIHFKQAP